MDNVINYINAELLHCIPETNKNVELVVLLLSVTCYFKCIQIKNINII